MLLLIRLFAARHVTHLITLLSRDHILRHGHDACRRYGVIRLFAMLPADITPARYHRFTSEWSACHIADITARHAAAVTRRADAVCRATRCFILPITMIAARRVQNAACAQHGWQFSRRECTKCARSAVERRLCRASLICHVAAYAFDAAAD